MSKIFISLSGADETFAHRLAQSLQYDFGAKVWVYFKDNIGFMKWSAGVQEGLDECGIMVLIVSPDAVTSDNVENEWHYYLGQKKPIVLVLLKRVENLPYELIRRPQVDFHEQDYDEAFKGLCAVLQSMGVEPKKVSTPIKINRNKTGNLWWLCHDLMELHRWLLTGISKEWLDVGFRQSHHHVNELGLDENVIVRLRELRDRADAIQEENWTQERRAKIAGEVKDVFNIIAQVVQGADPNFVSGQG